MSRAAVSKSRADKGGKPPVAHTPVVAHEIVPGKFTDQDWSFMMEKDDSEEFVEKIMDEILDETMNKIDILYREKQLLPFTVTMAKDAILQIIEWQFLSRDEGEENIESTDSGWMEDEEPDPAETDCWAQGSVPKNFLPPRPMSPVAEIFDEKPDEDLLPDEEEEEQVTAEQEPEELEDKVSDTEQTDQETADKKQAEMEKEQEKEQKKKKKFRPYRGKISSAPLKKLTESLEETEMKLAMAEFEATVQYESTDKASELINMPASCHSIIKAQAGRPPGNKDVTYDEMGNVVAIIKFNPERLPSHRVKINYQVVDPTVEVAQERLEAMRHGKFVSKQIIRKKLKKEDSETAKQDKRSSSTSTKHSRTPLPPPLIESMEIAAGVTVKEGGRIKRGPPRYVRQGDMLTENRNLRPVGVRSSMAPQLEVSDLLDRQTPILRPIKDSPPLPPIVPHPPPKHSVTT